MEIGVGGNWGNGGVVSSTLSVGTLDLIWIENASFH